MDPALYRPAPGSVPDQPGVYRFLDADGRVIYVGKAKSLRSRLAQYFQDPDGLHARTRSMVWAAASVAWTVVATEVEALQLEYAWIKEFDPRFNVKYRDDKSYPYLAVSVGEEFPRAQVMRGTKRKGVRYFGPYSHAWAIRETLDQLLRVFPIRSCSAGVFKRAGQMGRPCLLGYIDKCTAPCVGRISADDHRVLVDDLCAFLAGDTARFVKLLQSEMKEAADAQEYERAARLRDDIKALERALERNTVVLPDGTDADVVAMVEDELEAAFHIFHVRGGRVRGQRGMVSEKVDDVEGPELMEQFLTYLYGEVVPDAIPREVLIGVAPADTSAISQWLADRRGSNVDVRRPVRGDKRSLMQTVEQNAKHALALHKVRRSGDLTARAVALEELQEALGMAEAPLRIECFDISHLAGSDPVASMVVFEDGVPRTSDYRRFSVKTPGGDDAGAMAEVIGRRFRRLLDESRPVDVVDGTVEGAASPTNDPEVEGGTASDVSTGRRPKRFAYRPQLVVVDGGPVQAAAAADAITDLGVTDVTVVGLAKRLEEVWVAGDDAPIILPRGSQGLFLLQRVRDEAHRFAITYQRHKRGRRATASVLDAIPGLGAERKRVLLRHFGSVRRIKGATVEQLQEVPGIGPRLAATIAETLRDQPSAEQVDTSTGEITGDS
ncbi:MAG TPA: excinuclease ABC subunit UvrC [Actinomycetes bacterium]|nr:excinuclease ABC subunit UvrC [Actinomycetes bacterium]